MNNHFILNKLISSGADVNKGNPLLTAVMERNFNMVTKLLAHGANVNARDNNGNTVFDRANIDEAILKTLQDHKRNLESTPERIAEQQEIAQIVEARKAALPSINEFLLDANNTAKLSNGVQKSLSYFTCPISLELPLDPAYTPIDLNTRGKPIRRYDYETINKIAVDNGVHPFTRAKISQKDIIKLNISHQKLYSSFLSEVSKEIHEIQNPKTKLEPAKEASQTTEPKKPYSPARNPTLQTLKLLESRKSFLDSLGEKKEDSIQARESQPKPTKQKAPKQEPTPAHQQKNASFLDRLEQERSTPATNERK